MVIVTTEYSVVHGLSELITRKHRQDCYVRCLCGYQGPSHATDTGNGEREAMRDLELHTAAEPDAGRSGRWVVKLSKSACRPDVAVVLWSADPEDWKIEAFQQEQVEEGRAELARQIRQQGVFVADVGGSFTKIKGVKSFELTRKVVAEHMEPILVNGDLRMGVLTFNQYSPPCTLNSTVCGGPDASQCTLATAKNKRCPR